MYDSHTHLTSDQLSGQLMRVLERFSGNGGKGILDVGHDIESSYQAIENCKKYQGINELELYCSIGLHPTLVGHESHYENPIKSIPSANSMLDLIRSTLERNRSSISAIGECGLDYYQLNQGTSYTMEEIEGIKEIQRHLFREQVKIAQAHNLPLTIHTRDIETSTSCLDDALSICAEVGVGTLFGSFHSYTGSATYLQDINNMGFSVGFNAIATYKSGSSILDLLTQIPHHFILIESDAPYLPLRDIVGKRAEFGEPTDIKKIATILSEKMGLGAEEFAKLTSENFKRIFILGSRA